MQRKNRIIEIHKTTREPRCPQMCAFWLILKDITSIKFQLSRWLKISALTRWPPFVVASQSFSFLWPQWNASGVPGENVILPKNRSDHFLRHLYIVQCSWRAPHDCPDLVPVWASFKRGNNFSVLRESPDEARSRWSWEGRDLGKKINITAFGHLCSLKLATEALVQHASLKSWTGLLPRLIPRPQGRIPDLALAGWETQ